MHIWGDLKIPVQEDLNSAGIESSLLFTNYAHDLVTDKYFAQARFYDAERGRMLGRDPIKRGMNAYPYCKNDPINYVDPTGEIANIIGGGILGGLVGGTFGFVGSAISQKLSGKSFDAGKAWGAAANGAAVGAIRGALVGSGAGIGLTLASNFVAGATGSALEQKIGRGSVNLRESITSGLTNAASGEIYGNNPLKSAGDALRRGVGAGASNMQAGMITPSSYGRKRDPRSGCGAPSPFNGKMSYGASYGYQYKETSGGTDRSKKAKSGGFSIVDFAKDVMVGGLMGGLSSVTFYGAGKAVSAVRNSIKSSANYNPRIKMDLQYFADKGSGNKPNFIVTSKGAVMDTSKNYNLIGSGEKGDWFQIHNYGKPEAGFSFPHTHSPQINTNGAYTSVNRIVSNTTEMDINLADQLLRTGQMVIRKGRR